MNAYKTLFDNAYQSLFVNNENNTLSVFYDYSLHKNTSFIDQLRNNKRKRSNVDDSTTYVELQHFEHKISSFTFDNNNYLLIKVDNIIAFICLETLTCETYLGDKNGFVHFTPNIQQKYFRSFDIQRYINLTHCNSIYSISNVNIYSMYLDCNMAVYVMIFNNSNCCRYFNIYFKPGYKVDMSEQTIYNNNESNNDESNTSNNESNNIFNNAFNNFILEYNALNNKQTK